MRRFFPAFALALLLIPPMVSAAQVRAAVASNFTDAIKKITARFEQETGNRVELIFGSTGKHYAQIRNGAPFDVFFAADVRRPRLLDDEGSAVAGSRFTYAVGRIVLWSPHPGYIEGGSKVLRAGTFQHIAIANPRLAPYGVAAQQVLESMGLWQGLQRRIVRGENISQTYQFVSSGSAELGFVALSQVKRPGEPIKGSYWMAPPESYSPIEQQAVLLTHGRDNAAARAFLSFVQGPEARKIIEGFGYATSAPDTAGR